MISDKAHTTLILGGARSGKSSFAERLCEESTLDLLYVATSPHFENDSEMTERIRHHQQRRGQRWNLIEEEIALDEVLAANSRENTAILIDCMTLWLNNLLYHNKSIESHISLFIEAMQSNQSQIILISNEVGQGIVPADANTRRFRDEQGWLNQSLATTCDRVIEVRAGLPLQLKPTPYPAISLQRDR